VIGPTPFYFEKEQLHVRMSATGTHTEKQCPCVKAPCGYAVRNSTRLCNDHAAYSGRIFADTHDGDQCPAAGDLAMARTPKVFAEREVVGWLLNHFIDHAPDFQSETYDPQLVALLRELASDLDMPVLDATPFRHRKHYRHPYRPNLRNDAERCETCGEHWTLQQHDSDSIATFKANPEHQHKAMMSRLMRDYETREAAQKRREGQRRMNNGPTP
jgi:hypothetical protein